MLSLGQRIVAIGVMLLLTVALTVFMGLLGFIAGIGATAVMAPAVLRL
ncbi:hypothetical protein ACKVMT_11775 [Halobacteriales archaeon Cl-PHB]